MNNSDEFNFNCYFNNSELSEELRNFYRIINEEELTEEISKESKLTDIRDENYKRYININLVPYKNLSDDFEDMINEIKKIYSYILPDQILIADLEESYKIKKIIDFIYLHIEKLNNFLKTELVKLVKCNDDRQIKIKNINFSDFDKKTLHEVMNKYSDIVLYSTIIEDDIISKYNREVARKEKLNELCRIINLELGEIDITNNILKTLNDEINEEANNINNKILYLQDLMIEKSKYQKEFNIFKNYFVNLVAYDDIDYGEVNRVHCIICEDLKFKSLISYFEDCFIKERESMKQEKKFICEKVGIKNLQNSLHYISANYIDLLNQEEKNVIDDLYNKLNNNTFVLKDIYYKLSKIVDKIWKETITDIYKYDGNKDFCFICSNNQFIDEKYQTILMTNKMLDRIDDYSDYQIGFICSFNNNILYVTENDDIMTVEHNDMSNLKTPKQIEQEFINFKVSNRIALNGYLTKVIGVYIIDDNDTIKYKKAVELSNQHKVPLIVLKKIK